MTLVGPRPQLVRDMVFMTDEQRMRHCVRPGLSGLAQTRGRNALSWDGKLATDLEYIENVTFFGDVKIIVNTVKQVFFKEKGIEGGTINEVDITDDFGDYLLKVGRISKYCVIHKTYNNIMSPNESRRSKYVQYKSGNVYQETKKLLKKDVIYFFVEYLVKSKD